MSRFRRSAALVAIAAALTGLPAVAAPARTAKDMLTQTEAMARSQQVNRVSYDLHFWFEPDSDHYHGTATIRFSLEPGTDDVTLDYAGEQVDKVVVNGTPIAVAYNKAFITVPRSALGSENTVTATFSSNFDTGGTGIMRVVDPLDKKTYIYTDFEPYGAHHLFPCFDQPDLKARFTLGVTAPADWAVISNTLPNATEPAGTNKTTTFPASGPISTYLFALHTGGYVTWHDKAGNIPLGLYARASLAKHVDADTIFTITKQGLAFYQRYFDYPYPYSKYDQIFCPELAEDAMENPGAVTLSENNIYRHEVTDTVRYDRDDTVVHEMAHMWFGDLVTMRWWNDLWLNESFATYMAAVCKAELPPRYGDSWSMFVKMKEWAYDIDDRTTTHPIEAQIADTNAASENFDGITYGKGASVMKQLAYFMGPDAFRDGVRQYFKQYAYGNTTLREFMASLQAKTHENLGTWTTDWLQSAGLNTVQPTITYQNGRITAFSLAQSASSGADVRRQHRTEIGLFDLGRDGHLKLRQAIPVSYSGNTTTLTALKGKASAPLVFTNVHDQDYAKVRLDPQSLKTVEAKLSAVTDPAVRQQLWIALWYMVQDRQLDVVRYLDLLERHLPAETTPVIVEVQLKRLQTAFTRYFDPADRATVGARLEPFVWSQLQRQKPGSDAQMMWMDTLLAVSRSPAGLDRLAGLVQGTVTVPGLQVNQDVRWDIIQTLTASGHAKAASLFEAECRQDTTDLGLKAAERVRAAKPDASAKAAAWQRIVTDTKSSLGQLEAPMGGFWDLETATLCQPYVSLFFAVLPGVFENREPGFASAFYKRMFPVLSSADVLKQTETLLARTDLSNELRNKLMDSKQEVARSLAIQAAAKQALAASIKAGGR